MNYFRRVAALLLFCIICIVSALNVGTYPARAREQKEPLVSANRLLSLEECIRFAAQNSFEIKLAQLDYLISEQDLGIAKGIFDASLSAEVSYEEDKRETLSTLAGTQTQTNIYSIEATKTLSSGTELALSFDDTRDWSDSAYVAQKPAHTAETTFEVRQPVGKNIFGFIDRRDIAVTKLAIQNADLDTQERIEVLFADVEKAYWKWLFAQESLEIQRKILEKAENLHRTNTRNYDIGRIERADFLASQANVLIREKDVLVAENEYRRAEEELKLLMNMETAFRIQPQETLQYRRGEPKFNDCLVQAFQKRRDYQKAKRDVEIKRIVLQTKANKRWPEIDLVASFTANGIDSKFDKAASRITSEDNTKYYAGVEISIPLENNLTLSEFRQAQHNKEKVIIILKNVERTIVTEVANAFRDYITYETNLNNLIEAARLQQEKLKEEEKRFNYGRSTTKTLIDYQQDYLNGQLEVAKGILELETARVNLEKSLNIILEKYGALL